MTRSTTLRLLYTTLTVAAGLGCGGEDLATEAVAHPEPGAQRQRVVIHQPSSLVAVGVGMTDHQGEPVGIDCMTCHSAREEHELPDDAHDIGSIHDGMIFTHGSLSCRSCHDPERADRLRLADGTPLEMVEAMRLCAQCHGPQARDFEAGSHGGRRGYWDRRRGPAARNHCVDCHDPHRPAFPVYRPMPPPRDRFLDEAAPEAGGHHE